MGFCFFLWGSVETPERGESALALAARTRHSLCPSSHPNLCASCHLKKHNGSIIQHDTDNNLFGLMPCHILLKLVEIMNSFIQHILNDIKKPSRLGGGWLLSCNSNTHLLLSTALVVREKVPHWSANTSLKKSYRCFPVLAVLLAVEYITSVQQWEAKTEWVPCMRHRLQNRIDRRKTWFWHFSSWNQLPFQESY